MRWLTPAEAAEYAHTSPDKVSEAARSGDIVAFVKPWGQGRHVLMSDLAVDEWVRSWPCTAEGRREDPWLPAIPTAALVRELSRREGVTAGEAPGPDGSACAVLWVRKDG